MSKVCGGGKVQIGAVIIIADCFRGPETPAALQRSLSHGERDRVRGGSAVM